MTNLDNTTVVIRTREPASSTRDYPDQYNNWLKDTYPGGKENSDFLDNTKLEQDTYSCENKQKEQRTFRGSVSNNNKKNNEHFVHRLTTTTSTNLNDLFDKDQV